jgi:glycosyltransferase involved in cell wall biosynthesis
MAEISIIVPVRERAHNVAPLIESLQASTDRAELVFVADADDTAQLWALERHNADVILNWDRDRKTFPVKANLGYRLTDSPWIMLCGDDVHFHPGWVEASIDLYPDAGLISTNDLGNSRVRRGEHAVHPIFRRTWVETNGASWDGADTLCHEGYGHCFVDDEWSTVAKQAGAFVYAPDAIVEHLHPVWGKAKQDRIYRIAQQQMDIDRIRFQRRRRAYAS